MRHLSHRVSQLVLVAPLVALVLSGCATTEPGTVSYPDGHYKMYGDGINTPYYWVWIPNGVSEASIPAPPPLPMRTAVVTTPAPTTVVTTTPVVTTPAPAAVVTTTPVVTAPAPATVVTTTPVVTAPAPATVVTTTPVPTPVVSAPAAAVVTTVPAVSPTPTTVVSANGRYQLYGDGVSTPYYWVWIPTGTTPPIPPPPPR